MTAFGSSFDADLTPPDDIDDTAPIGTPRDRSTFLYFEPHPDTPQHAQCLTCVKWGMGNRRCESLQADDVVTGKDSCGIYEQGKPQVTAEPSGRYTKKEVGFVSHKVRCQNCNVFDDRDKSNLHCDLYVQLNRLFPRLFKLDVKVKPHGCCNAQSPGKRDPKRFGPYGPIPDADDPNVGGLVTTIDGG